MTYRTNGTKNQPRLCCNNQLHCENKSAVYKDVEDAVEKSLKETLGDLKAIYKGDKSKGEGAKKRLLESIEKDITRLQEQKAKLYEFLEEGIYTKDVFKQRMKLLEEKYNSLLQAHQEAQNMVEEKDKYHDAIIKLEQALKAINNKNISAEKKNKLLVEIIEDIIYTRKVSRDRRHYHDIPFSLDIKLKI